MKGRLQFYAICGLGWMVIIGHWSSKSTFGANKKTHLITLVLSAFDLKTENWCLLFALQNQVANAPPCFSREKALIIWMNLNMKFSTL